MVAHNGLTAKGSGSGNLQKMQKNVIRRLFEIERRNLARHVHGDPALKSQHHILEGPVQVMDLIQVKPFFQHMAMPNIHFFGIPDPSPSLPWACRCT